MKLTSLIGSNTNTSTLLEVLSRFDGTSILVVGDVMLDRYVFGNVTRISPEAPIPVLHVVRESMILGGAGNVLSNIGGLGGKPLFASVIGDDKAGDDTAGLIGALTQAGLVRVPGRPTTVKTRYVSGGQQMLRVDHEVTDRIEAGVAAQLVHAIEAVIPEVKAVIVSDYAKGVVTEAVVTPLIAAATRQGIPVVVDAKPGSFQMFRGATLLKPNRRELSAATGMAVDTDEEVVAAAIRLMEISGVGAIVATRSEKGVSVVEANGEVLHIRTTAREVFDVSGAGDTVGATIALALGSGATLVEAVQLANYAAGIVVRKTGTAPVRSAELAEVLKEEPSQAAHKIRSLDDAVEDVERWRTRNVRVGFTNGCFDLLHPGHLALIAEARRHSDRLIVGLNSDASTRRLKGPNRPIRDQKARAELLAALPEVDLVVMFEEDTPVHLIERLRPDVLVKGAEYTEAEVAGADIVRGYGGEVVRVPMLGGHSTSSTIARMGSR